MYANNQPEENADDGTYEPIGSTNAAESSVANSDGGTYSKATDGGIDAYVTP